MNATWQGDARSRSSARQAYSPFLREATRALVRTLPSAFVAEGRGAGRSPRRLAIEADDSGAELRRRRHGLGAGRRAGRPRRRARPRAGDRRAVRLRRRGDRRGAPARRSPSACPDADAGGLRGPGARQARQPRAQLFVRRRPDPAVRPGDACRAASATSRARRRCAIGRRLVELLQQRTERRLCRPRRPAAPALARSHADRACRSTPPFPITKSQALPWERAAFIRARAAAGDRALGERFLERDPAVHLAPGARFRRDRRNPRHLACASAIIMRRARRSARASTSSAAAAASARSSSSPRSSS